jgi:hypothetical protein
LRRLHILAPAIAIAAVALATLASAASANGGGHHHRGYSTPGVLEASGDGIAAAAGKLTLHVCAEDGLLITKGSVSIEEGGFTDEVSWLGLHVYFGFSGCADIGPEELLWDIFGYGGSRKTAALVAGTGLTLRAEGTGIAFLKGTGTWSDDGGGSGDWTEEGTILKIGGKKHCEVEAQHDGGGYDKPDCATPTAEATEEPTEEPEPEPTEEP